jgi:uncharacterized protein (TIGR02001 family)
MQKSKLLVAVLGAVCSMSVMAADAPAPAITGNVGFASDYVFNGISQTFRSPAIQGGFDYAAANGLYVGTWASNISGNQYTNASMELDVYAGYNGKVSDDLGYQIGLMNVTYPNGKAFSGVIDTNNNITSAYKRWDTTEAILGATWKSLNVKLTYTFTDWYGINNGGYSPFMWADGSSAADSADADLSSKGSTYVEANYTYEISEGLSVTAHAGHQKIQNFAALDYTDYKLAVSKAYAGFNFGLAYTTTNATDNSLYHVKANGDDKVLSGNILAASVTRSF